MDVEVAFLTGDLDESMPMKCPSGIGVPNSFFRQVTILHALVHAARKFNYSLHIFYFLYIKKINVH